MFRTAPTWLQALVVGQLVNAAGALTWLYLTVYLVTNRHLEPSTAGLVTGTYGVGVIGGNLLGGSVGDRVGLKPTIVASLACWGLGSALFPFTPTGLLAPLGLVAGLTGGAGRPVMSALVAAALPPGQRREAIAMSRAASNAGTVIGPPIGGLLAAHHFDVVFALDAVTSLVLMAVVVRFVPASSRTVVASGPTRVLDALRHDRTMLGLVGSVLAVDTAYRLLYTVLPLFLLAHGASPVVYGLTVSLNCVVIVLLEPRIARRLRGHRAVLVVSSGYAVVGLGWLVLGAVPVVVGALVAVVVITGGEMLYKPTATALAADLAPPGMAGRYQSLYAASSVGGMLLSPLLGTALYEAAPRLVFPVAGVVAVLAAVGFRRAELSAGSSAPVPAPVGPLPAPTAQEAVGT